MKRANAAGGNVPDPPDFELQPGLYNRVFTYIVGVTTISLSFTMVWKQVKIQQNQVLKSCSEIFPTKNYFLDIIKGF